MESDIPPSLRGPGMLLGAQLEAPSSLKTRKTCPASQARGPLKLDAGYFAQLEIKIAHWPEGRVTRGSAAPAVWGADLWGGLPCHQRRGCRRQGHQLSEGGHGRTPA